MEVPSRGEGHDVDEEREDQAALHGTSVRELLHDSLPPAFALYFVVDP